MQVVNSNSFVKWKRASASTSRMVSQLSPPWRRWKIVSRSLMVQALDFSEFERAASRPDGCTGVDMSDRPLGVLKGDLYLGGGKLLMDGDETWLGRMQLTIVMSGETRSFSASKGIKVWEKLVMQLLQMTALL